MKTINGLLAGALLAVAGLSPAHAADNTRPAPLRFAQQEFAYNWSGAYAGLHGGYGRGRSWYSDSLNTPNNNPASLSGGQFGGQVGFNQRFGRFVGGIELDFSYINGKSSNRQTMCDPAICGITWTRTSDASMPMFGTARGRLGVLLVEEMLIYATGGLAYGTLKGSVTDNFGALGTTTNSRDQFGVGFAVGAGVEYALYGNWTIKAEYLHFQLGHEKTASSTTGPLFGTTNFDSRSSVKGDAVRVGVNYKF